MVLDACGVGALPDAPYYGDAGTNTLGHLAHEAGGLELPTLARLGLGSIVEIEGVPPAASPVLHGRLGALGPGKDSTAGHWALMGVSAVKARPTARSRARPAPGRAPTVAATSRSPRPVAVISRRSRTLGSRSTPSGRSGSRSLAWGSTCTIRARRTRVRWPRRLS